VILSDAGPALALDVMAAVVMAVGLGDAVDVFDVQPLTEVISTKAMSKPSNFTRSFMLGNYVNHLS
jgi:hypothetical protein